MLGLFHTGAFVQRFWSSWVTSPLSSKDSLWMSHPKLPKLRLNDLPAVNFRTYFWFLWSLRRQQKSVGNYDKNWMMPSKSEEFLVRQHFWFCFWGLQSTQLWHWRSYLLAECCLWKTKLVQTRVTSLSGKYLQLIIWPRSLRFVLVHRFYFTDTRLRGKEHFKHSSHLMYLLAKLAWKRQVCLLQHYSHFGRQSQTTNTYSRSPQQIQKHARPILHFKHLHPITFNISSTHWM